MSFRRRDFLFAFAAAPGLRKKWIAGAEIPLPPPVHPRLYIRAEHIAELPVRLGHPALKAAVELIAAQAAKHDYIRVEWDAVHYLISRDEAAGRRIIAEALRILRATSLADVLDGARATGRIMVTGSIVYDWLYPLLTAEEKRAFVSELLRLAHTQECGYPPVRQGAVNGHTSEALLMRNMMSAGIAIYDEFPEMYELAAARFFREHVPARNWFYPGHAHHQGDSYGPGRFTWDTVALFIFDRMGAGNVYNPEQRWVPYHFLYSTRPDGQRLRSGNNYLYMTPKGQPWNEDLGTMLTASWYRDGILLDHHIRQRSMHPQNGIFEFLWRDVNLKPEPPDELPLSRYFGFPFGWMIARTGWRENAAIVEMKVNEYNFVNHQHLDAGAFQIYYRGALAIDSGMYQGSSGAYDSVHCRNYYWRTIAHNSLLVHDPNEDFGAPKFGNDGGQRIPNGRRETLTLDQLLDEKNGYRTAEVTAHGFGPEAKAPDYTILQGDLTKAYSSKVRQVQRSFVFFNFRDAQVPGALIVFDRVVSASPEFRKYWLLHSITEPRIEGARAHVDAQGQESGRLTLDVLLPSDAEVSAVGGPGREYWVFGRNFENNPHARYVGNGSIEAGAWRIEVTPARNAESDLFLTVMQMTVKDSGAHWPVSPLRSAEREGCLIGSERAAWAVLFRTDSVRSGSAVEFTVASNAAVIRILVCDLEAGSWTAVTPGGERLSVDVSESSGTAWLTGEPGSWRLVPASDRMRRSPGG